jgi:hypothetical protein
MILGLFGFFIFAFKKNLKHIAYLSFFLGILIATLMVSLSRHRYGAQQAFASRYFIFAFLTIPFLCFFWIPILSDKTDAKKKSFLISIFIFLGYLNDWSYSAYASTKEARNQQLSCLKKYLPSSYRLPSSSDLSFTSKWINEPVDCPTSYPGDLNEMLNRAVELDVQFIKDLKGP